VALALVLRDHDAPQLKGQVLIYPVLGADVNTPSYIRNAQAPCLTKPEMIFYLDCFLGPKGNPNWFDPRAIPNLAHSLEGLPPTYISVAAHDPLHDDGVIFYEKLRAAGIPAILREEPALAHSFMRARHVSEPAKKARQAALEEYRNINLYTSDFPGGSYNLGIMYANAGDLDKAIESYREALKTDDLFFMAKVNLATLYARQGKNNDAEKLLREVLRDNPEVVQVNYSLALLLAEMGRFDESRNYFLKAAELMPEETRIFYNLGLLENSQGNKVAAENYLLKALDREPDNFDFLYALSTFYLEQKQNARAIVYAKRLTEKFPDNPAGAQLLQAASNQ